MKTRDWIVATLMFALGVVGWVMIAKVSGRREAWDSELYFSVFMPSIAIIVGLVSWLIPRQYGRWAFLPFLGQARQNARCRKWSADRQIETKLHDRPSLSMTQRASEPAAHK